MSDVEEDNTMSKSRHEITIKNVEEATVHRIMIETGGAEEYRKTTHLTLDLESPWTDYEDDTWCFFLRAFCPLSSNLQHLHINIRGTTLFTRHNYIKPNLSYSEVYIPDDDDSDDNSDSDQEAKVDVFLKGEDDSPSPNGVPKINPGKKAKKAPRKPRLNRYAVSPDEVDMHISEKLIVPELLRLQTPIRNITIKGPMTVSLRRHLISHLNPNWDKSPYLVSQYGLMPADEAKVEEAMEKEQDLLSMKKVLPNDFAVQDAEDFGVWGSREVGAPMLPTGWVVPTGKAGRTVLGWKGKKGVWRGPVQ